VVARHRRSLVLATVISFALLASVTASAGRATTKASAISIPAFTNSQLMAAPGNDWLTENGNDLSWRYDALSQINGSNGGSLKLAWSTTFATPTPPAGVTEQQEAGEGGNSIAYDGTVFADDPWARIEAINGQTGAILWQFDPLTGNGGRGAVSIGDGLVFTGSRGTVFGIDAKTGAQEWATQVVDPTSGSAVNQAPIYYDGMIIDGVNGGDGGGPVFIFALDAKTGKVLWHYNTIPSSPSAEGWNTWPAKRSFFGGGGTWDPVTVDPSSGLVYIGVANAIPFTGLLSGPGKELNTESVLALNAKTGKFKWVYQEIHHDIWDYDAMQTPIVANVTIGGKTVRVVNHTNKDAYNFVLNAATGVPVVGVTETPVPQDPAQHTYATQPIPNTETPGSPNEIIPHVPVNAADWSGIAPDGKPYIVAKVPYTPYDNNAYTVVAPTFLGGVEWPENSYSPSTGLVYMCTNITEFAYSSPPPSDIHVIGGSLGLLSILTSYSPTFVPTSQIVALNPANNTVAWRVQSKGANCDSQMLSTGGGVVLQSRVDGSIVAYNDKTGAQEWVLQTGSSSIPRFAVYGAGGKEYLVASGTTAQGGVTLNAFTTP
jgi:quinohemoprotein ethanol dehydrogenase